MKVSSHARLALPLFALAVLVGLASSGCEDKHIGRKCDLGLAGGAGTSGGSTAATINSQAVECPSRLCLQAAEEQPTTVGPLCTAECGGDDDCADGQLGDAASGLCQTGFKCTIATPVGAFCCKKMCVCKDFLVIDPKVGIPVHPNCMSGMGSTCQNVH
jgi:hypothetical protein